MIDCHAHIYPPEFTDLSTFIKTVEQDGVQAIVTVPETLAEAATVLTQSRLYPILHPSAGLHPAQLVATPSHQEMESPSSTLKKMPCYRPPTTEEIESMRRFIREHESELVCIGEVGLDYSPHVLGSFTDHDKVKDAQVNALVAHIQLSNLYRLPLNVHSRSAGHHALHLLQKHNASAAVLHAFDGRATYAEQAASAGYFLSVPPSVVRSPGKQKWISRVGLDRILLESDAPALAPIKDEKNTPSNIIVSCQEVAKIKGVSIEEVITTTTDNAFTLFPKLKSH